MKVLREELLEFGEQCTKNKQIYKDIYREICVYMDVY